MGAYQLGANTNTHIILLSIPILVNLINSEYLLAISSVRRGSSFMTLALSLGYLTTALQTFGKAVAVQDHVTGRSS